MGGGWFCFFSDWQQQECAGLSVSGHPKKDGIDGIAGHGDIESAVSLSDHVDRFPAVQGIWFDDQHGLKRGEVDSLAAEALREVKGGALGYERRFSWRQAFF